MAMVPGYKNDVFISFTHDDNRPPLPGVKGWIDSLHEALGNRFKEFYAKDLKIWRDLSLKGGDLLEPALAEQVHNSALLVSVLSPNYFNSEWCKKERIAFTLSAKRKGGLMIGTSLRSLNVVKTKLLPGQHLQELQESLIFPFYRINQLNDTTIDFRPETNQREFIETVERLVHAIGDLLARFAASQPHAAPQREKTIYLADTAYDLDEERARVKSELEQHGYSILPADDLPLKAPVHIIEPMVRDYLSRSRMSVVMVGASYGNTLPPDNERSLVQIQHELALEHITADDFQRVVWLSGKQTDEAKQQKFIERLLNGSEKMRGVELLQNDVGALKDTIHNLLKPKQKPKDPPEVNNGHGPARIYLVYDEPDYLQARQLRKHLLDEQFEVLIPEGKRKLRDKEEHEELLFLADAVMVYYGEASDKWTWQKLRELQKLPGLGRKKPLIAQAFYLSTPVTEDKDDFFTNEALVINGTQGFTPALLTKFIADIKRAKGAL
ncbi:MAG: TIR domain-containing protein [Blastocatellia bacterium]